MWLKRKKEGTLRDVVVVVVLYFVNRMNFRNLKFSNYNKEKIGE